MLAIGLRSSCAVSETRLRCRCWAASSRASMSLSVTARSCTSSRASGTGSSLGCPVSVTSWAPRRRAEIGRSVDPVTSQVTQASRSNSSGVPTSRPWVTASTLSVTGWKATPAITVSPVWVGTDTTRSMYGMPYGRPSSSTARPVRASARAWRSGSSGTRRSAPGEASMTKPRESSTWRVSVPAATGTGFGSLFLSASAATSCAPCLAVLSTSWVSDARSVARSSMAPTIRATASPAVVMTVRRPRRLRCRHHRDTARSSPVGGELVARAADGLQRPAAERAVDLAPQVARVDLDHVGIHRVVGVPDVLEQGGLGHHLPGPAHQVFEQGELPRRQLDRGLAAAYLPGARVEGEVAGLQLDRPWPGATAQQGAQPRSQHHVGERLGEVVVRAQVEPVRLVVLPVLGRQDEDRHPVLFGPQLTADLVPGDLGQHEIQDQRVVVTFPRQVQAIL